MIGLLRVSAALALSWLFLVIIMFVAQRLLMYPGHGARGGNPKDAGVGEMEILNLVSADGVAHLAWFAPPRVKTGKVVVLFHGNGGTIADRGFKARLFLDRGLGVLLCEYRGYGGSSGRPSERGFYADGESCVRWLEAEKGILPSRIVFCGESIGTGVATEMAVRFPSAGLVLEAPFISAVEASARMYPWAPVRLLLLDRYENDAKIARIGAPLLIVHGDADGVLPVVHGRRLFARAIDPKTYIEVKGAGHNDLYDFGVGQKIAAWIADLP